MNKQKAEEQRDTLAYFLEANPEDINGLDFSSEQRSRMRAQMEKLDRELAQLSASKALQQSNLIETLRGQITPDLTKDQVLIIFEQVFKEYQRQHHAKNTPDADQKAAANHDFAEAAQNALLIEPDNSEASELREHLDIATSLLGGFLDAGMQDKLVSKTRNFLTIQEERIVDYAINAWHASPDGKPTKDTGSTVNADGQTLPEFLGWSDKEYADWVSDPKDVPRLPISYVEKTKKASEVLNGEQTS